MIGLIEEIRKPRERFMERRKTETGILWREVNILGIRTLYISLLLPENLKEKERTKRIVHMRQTLREHRVSRLCFSYNFSDKHSFIGKSFVEMERRFLFELLAGNIAAAIAAVGAQTGYFYARSVSEREEKLLLSMCRHYRYIMLDVESGGALICQNIRRRLGISIVEHPTTRQLMEADTAVFFNRPRDRVFLPEKCITVGVDEASLKNVGYVKYLSAVRLELSSRIRSALPLGFPPEPLVSAALENGSVHPGEIKLQTLRIGKKSNLPCPPDRGNLRFV